MSAADSKQNQGFLSRATSVFRRGRDWLEIADYHIGDIKTEQPVRVLAGAALAGDIEAPRVEVAGLVFGFVTAREIVVEEDGQIWGDIYTATFQIARGGRVQGWVASLGEGTIDMLRAGELSTADLTEQQKKILPPELQDGAFATAVTEADDDDRRRQRLPLVRHLQVEAATAMLARLELERSFEARVSQVAGESLAEAASLRQESSQAQDEVRSLLARQEKLQETVRLRDDQVQAQAEELAAVREELDQRSADLAALQTDFAAQSAEFREQVSANERLISQIQAATNRKDELTRRAENLESALQSSLQRTAEQEEALLRWQELAEVTEEKAGRLESELESARRQLDESTSVVEMLRSQREKLELEWDNTKAELAETRQNRDMLQHQVEQDGSELERLRREHQEQQQELSALKEQMESQPAEYDELLQRFQASEEMVSQLEGRLNAAEVEVQDYADQLLWTKTSLKTTTQELEETRQELSGQQETLSRAQSQLAEQEGQVNKWRESVGRMTDLLYQAEQRVKELEEKQVESPANEEEMNELREQLRQRQLQLDAYESEVDFYHREMDTQRNRLADMQATLVEREIEIDKVRQTARKLAGQREQIKKLAGQRIQKLEGELKQTRQQLKDLSVWLDRRRRRGEDVGGDVKE